MPASPESARSWVCSPQTTAQDSRGAQKQRSRPDAETRHALQVQEAAVIAVPHEKWTERPLLLVVPHEGQALTEADILDHLQVPRHHLHTASRLLLRQACLMLQGGGHGASTRAAAGRSCSAGLCMWHSWQGQAKEHPSHAGAWRAQPRLREGSCAQGRLAKWSLPDRVVLVDSLPHTATGKVATPTVTCWSSAACTPGPPHRPAPAGGAAAHQGITGSDADACAAGIQGGATQAVRQPPRRGERRQRSRGVRAAQPSIAPIHAPLQTLRPCRQCTSAAAFPKGSFPRATPAASLAAQQPTFCCAPSMCAPASPNHLPFEGQPDFCLQQASHECVQSASSLPHRPAAVLLPQPHSWWRCWCLTRAFIVNPHMA